ncbi:DUF3157 family protein [Vibrio sp. RE86]|uniref:DUF3157 family protein n=1 Tax=Vibrio sp. RE86 TaxID=2607605 RepID=UPI001493C4D1|nr:DUF3157 family protein [Vibrio sp. RE86]NOH81398.1 DUF3157 family protein [Vibrio sp. RE86]
MKPIIALCGLMATSQLFAAQVLTLDDGRQVQLNDDFTWQYVVKEKYATEANTTEATQATPLAAIPVVTKSIGTLVEVGSKKATLQLSDSGVDILLGATQYQDGQLVIPTSITNQSRLSVVSIELHVEVLDISGQKLAEEKVKIWSSIKRMADTYLRPEQIVQGKPILIDVEQEQQYQINAKVSEIETR